ncbi:MAG: branched-chain amino acid ABC transporter permease [Dehalococcoidia bacterium]|jgi:branched-chain amino acid transport system permease protein|nr:MAG: branched-chain amino acid ABC transporter permease [Dehalococcoidia bacterium]
MDLPAGTRNYSYAQDMAIFRTKTHWILLGVLILLLFAMPAYWHDWLSVVNRIGITIIAVMGLNILTGYCGQLSIGHAGFIAVGAYTSAILVQRFGVPFPVALICAGLFAGVVGMLFGVPSLRVKGFYLAISTIAAQFIIIWVIQHWTSVTGGFSGMDVKAASIGPMVFRSQASQYYLILIITIISVYFAKNLSRTRVGRAFIAVRDNDLAAEVMGISLFRYKLTAFFIGCFFAGVAGSLLAHTSLSISADYFPLTDSILFIGMIIIGGMGTILGPILGVIFIRLIDVLVTELSPALQNAFPNLPSGFTSGIAPLLFGLAIILFIIFEPRGLAHRWQLFKASYRLWPFSY